MNIIIGHEVYTDPNCTTIARVQIHWRHLRPPTKLPAFTAAATTCVIVVDAVRAELILIGTTFCSNFDNFSRREGRLRSLKNALREGGLLEHERESILRVLLRRETREAPAQRRKLSIPEKSARWSDGAAVRLARQEARGASADASSPSRATEGPC